ERFGSGVGFALWNPLGLRLADALHSGWPLFALLRALRPRLRRAWERRVGPRAAEVARRLAHCALAAPQGGWELRARQVCDALAAAGAPAGGACPLLPAQRELMVARATLRRLPARGVPAEGLAQVEAAVDRADRHLRSMLVWIQPRGGFAAPAARILMLFLVAADVVLPHLVALQRRLHGALDLRYPSPSPRSSPASPVSPSSSASTHGAAWSGPRPSPTAEAGRGMASRQGGGASLYHGASLLQPLPLRRAPTWGWRSCAPDIELSSGSGPRSFLVPVHVCPMCLLLSLTLLAAMCEHAEGRTLGRVTYVHWICMSASDEGRLNDISDPVSQYRHSGPDGGG
ncbi:unnamed protein product, partial [Prorocentrum cordatum]